MKSADTREAEGTRTNICLHTLQIPRVATVQATPADRRGEKCSFVQIWAVNNLREVPLRYLYAATERDRDGRSIFQRCFGPFFGSFRFLRTLFRTMNSTFFRGNFVPQTCHPNRFTFPLARIYYSLKTISAISEGFCALRTKPHTRLRVCAQQASHPTAHRNGSLPLPQ